jgi:protein-S-isoprenylcysteine O-methyltransferase Ste14
VTRGSYAYVRHPLYFFSLLLIWFLPIMTLSALLFSSMATLYFWIGSIYEERRLSATFGDAYSQYKQRVPRLIPIKITNLC